MTREEEILAAAESTSRLDELIRFEEFALSAWPKAGNSGGYQEQINRIIALKTARSVLIKTVLAQGMSAGTAETGTGSGA